MHRSLLQSTALRIAAVAAMLASAAVLPALPLSLPQMLAAQNAGRLAAIHYHKEHTNSPQSKLISICVNAAVAKKLYRPEAYKYCKKIVPTIR